MTVWLTYAALVAIIAVLALSFDAQDRPAVVDRDDFPASPTATVESR